MVRAAAERLWETQHEKAPFHDGTFTTWSDKFSPLTPYHFQDGARTLVTDIEPEDNFLDDWITGKSTPPPEPTD